MSSAPPNLASDSAPQEPCSILEWDSTFFGKKIARVQGDQLTDALSRDIDQWCRTRNVDCLYFVARSDDQQTVECAARSHFALVDVRMTFERSTGNLDVGASASLPVRVWREDDLPTLESIARTSYRDTRFYYDSRFPIARCDDLYAHWITTSCRGYAKTVLVWDEGDGCGGFVTCHVADDGASGSIGLVGVHERMRGRGVGAGLVNAAMHWFAAQSGLGRVTVVTQGRNIAAQRIYQRCGFLTASVELYYHKWFD